MKPWMIWFGLMLLAGGGIALLARQCAPERPEVADSLRVQRDSLIKVFVPGLAHRDTVVDTLRIKTVINAGKLARLQARADSTDAAARDSATSKDWVIGRTRAERDSALSGWALETTYSKQKDRILTDDSTRLWAAYLYQYHAEARINTLEKRLRGPRLLGLPLPKVQCTAGLATRLHPDAVCGIGYSFTFGHK